MNERIFELANKAGFENGHQDRNGNSLSGELEKFAELLIRECIEQCEKQEYDYWRAPEDQEFTPQDCADALARHFGVK
jgi:hypothetical protein